MKNMARLLSLALSLLLALQFAAPAAALEVWDMAIYSAVVRFEDGANVDELCTELEKLPGVSVRWKYEALFPGAAVEGSEAALRLVEGCERVKSVSSSRTWALPLAVGDPAGTSNSLDVLNAEDIAYDGSGTVIAVIDSGTLVTHEVFRNSAVVTQPVISEEVVDTFAKNGGTEGRYISEKIPFIYDYSGEDRSVHTTDAHGTHVAALAAGCALNADGSVKFQGVAPAAQILAMKVFPDNASLGARDEDILKAIEDAYLLGADVVNLSLGTEGDFMEGDAIGALYQETIARLRAEGIIVCCAVGNAATAVTGKGDGVALPTTDYTDYGTPCVPAVYPGATAIAAVNAATREGGGGIVVGGKTFSYTKAVSENETEILPDLDDLSGKLLPYVVIGGLGAEEDFAGLDLTGCVALVRRGELYFSEKTNNAAAAGAVACLIYNNEDSNILPAVDKTTIPCAVISRETGEFMVKQAKNGRGMLNIEPNRNMVSTGDRLTMMAYSSWGATSDLRLVPKLTAPGGEILSAVTGGASQYAYMSGTSMATPNASGSFAVLLQALRERGIENRTVRAELAEDLLASTAAILTDEDGTYLSPRQQGAGVIDLGTALESPAVIRDPIIDLGDSKSGFFTISFEVENLSDAQRKFSVDASVLTDAVISDEKVVYSGLSPVDLTEWMTVSGADSVTVAAGGKRTVRLTLRIDSELRNSLAQVYTNGFFMEGYVTLTDEEGTSVHATFMGYCGDWSAAPVIEQGDFRDLLRGIAAGTLDEESVAAPGVNMWYNLAYLDLERYGGDRQLMPGENPWLMVEPLDERNALSTADTEAMLGGGQLVSIAVYTLRNAAHIIMTVTDRSTGAIYKVTDMSNVVRSDIGAAMGLPLPSVYADWDGTDSSGRVLESGTAVDITFYAWMESDAAVQEAYGRSGCCVDTPNSYRWLTSGSYRKFAQWSFPMMLDGEPPVVAGASAAENGVELTVKDNQFLAYAAVQDGEGNELAREAFAAERKGEEHVLTLPGELPDVVYLTLVDYAGNTMGYELRTAQPGDWETGLCYSALFSDVRQGAWYHEAVDYVCENGLMDGTDPIRFEPDRMAMRATLLETLYRLAGEPVVADENLPFADVREHEWYYDAVRWAYLAGVADGYGETIFAPTAPIIRQQLAAMLYRAAKLGGEVTDYDDEILDSFADIADVSGWAREAMAWAVGEGIFTGDSAGKLNPRAAATRAELAQILMNILKDNKTENQ